jgi:SAM-dependent methyltransferase
MISTCEEQYFRKSYEREWQQFWSRLPLEPDILRGKRVLDLGCGYGAFCVRAAEAGASAVVGLDLDERRIELCRHFLESEHAGFASTVEFRAAPIESISGEEFDIVISNETLEHVLDLPSAVDAVERVLVPGGIFIAGWGPLWHSPHGGHSYTWKVFGRKVPWAHVFFPELTRRSYRKYNRGLDLAGPNEAGLNALSIEEFRELFERSPLSVGSWVENAGGRPGYRLMRTLAGLGPCKRFFTLNVYAVLQKSAP